MISCIEFAQHCSWFFLVRSNLDLESEDNYSFPGNLHLLCYQILRFDHFPGVGIAPSFSLLLSSIKSRSTVPSAGSVPALPTRLTQISWGFVPFLSPAWWSHNIAWDFQVSIKKKFLAFLGTHNCFEVWVAHTFKGQKGSIKQNQPTTSYSKTSKAPWFPYALTIFFF